MDRVPANQLTIANCDPTGRMTKWHLAALLFSDSNPTFLQKIVFVLLWKSTVS